MKAKQDYYSLQAEIEAIEKSVYPSLYLSDQCVDLENAKALHDEYALTEHDEQYWEILSGCACDAAGMRAEEYGLNINKLIGRIIY